MSAAERTGGTVVLGLGNPVLRDDGAGLAVVAALSRLLEETPVPGVEVLSSTRAGFELIDLLQGYHTAIIVDCITRTEPQPGRIHRLALDGVAGSGRLIGGHDISVSIAFELAARLGISMPKEVEIIGIEAADTCTIVEELSPEVAAVVEPLARELHAQLAAFSPTGSMPTSTAGAQLCPSLLSDRPETQSSGTRAPELCEQHVPASGCDGPGGLAVRAGDAATLLAAASRRRQGAPSRPES